MRFNPSLFSRFAPLALVSLLFALTVSAARAAADFKFEVQLVWATTATNSPNPEHKPVEEEVHKKLSELPLKWKHYFEVKSENIRVSKNETREARLSKICRISVRDIDGKNFEFALIGKNEPVLKRTQKLPKGEMLVLGGNAPDATAWLVVLKRIE
jgi:hypothetical protein